MQDFLGPGIGIGAAGGPVGIIVTVIGTIVSALFGGIFGGSADQNIINAFNGIRDQMVAMGKALMKFAWSIAQGLGALFNLLKFIWGNVLRPIVQALKGLMERVTRIMRNILKPILDAMKAQRAAILDLYNRFIRPIIVAIEKIRRIIHLFQLLHIHIFDQLDRTLAKIEGKILAPIYAMLYRVNTLGNWVSFILNGYLLIYRGLFLGTMNANRGGSFSLLANAPAYGFVELPHVDQAPGITPAPESFTTAAAAIAAASPDIRARVAGTPAGELVACWDAPIGSIDLSAAIDDMVKCILS